MVYNNSTHWSDTYTFNIGFKTTSGQGEHDLYVTFLLLPNKLMEANDINYEDVRFNLFSHGF